MSDPVEKNIRRLDEITILEREGQGLAEARQVTETVLWQAVDEGLDRYFERKDAADLAKVREELASLTKEKRRGIDKGGIPE